MLPSRGFHRRISRFYFQSIKVFKRTMIDCHCHISAHELDEDRDELIQKAKQSGVSAIVAVCEFPSDAEKIMELTRRYSGFIYPCIGTHPIQTNNKSVSLQDFEKVVPFIEKYLSQLVGIGEIGLDFTPRYITSPEDKNIQRQVFRKQIELAKTYDLPVNVHSRSAGRPVIDLLIEEGATKVVLHAFDGKVSVAMKGVEAGFFFSVPPSIVRSEQKQKLVSKIPLSNLLLETDAPALGPEKMERNVPANIKISCQEIARIKSLSIDEVVETTSRNARSLFGIK